MPTYGSNQLFSALFAGGVSPPSASRLGISGTSISFGSSLSLSICEDGMRKGESALLKGSGKGTGFMFILNSVHGDPFNQCVAARISAPRSCSLGNDSRPFEVEVRASF